MPLQPGKPGQLEVLLKICHFTVPAYGPLQQGDAVPWTLVSGYILYETFEPVFLGLADRADIRRTVAGTQVAAYLASPYRQW